MLYYTATSYFYNLTITKNEHWEKKRHWISWTPRCHLNITQCTNNFWVLLWNGCIFLMQCTNILCKHHVKLWTDTCETAEMSFVLLVLQPQTWLYWTCKSESQPQRFLNQWNNSFYVFFQVFCQCLTLHYINNIKLIQPQNGKIPVDVTYCQFSDQKIRTTMAFIY